ncbi:MAG: gamma carbonic anhydrase family protein [Bacteroidia bacterium]|nr:gamma carbonic anhydrase family protein [Bacteroidia bacterium]MCC7532930.1 gamma carbonic anhydrase family protein [Bacteroidia bacterium]MCZ2141452.1 gamma carbonic anhydrase family protein [Bacteroidia bacterium]
MAELKDILQKQITKKNGVWIADTARVIGNVSLGEHCSVWYGAVIRGDRDSITIGEGSNIQDNVVMHVDPGYPIVTGVGCIIGHGAIVHGAKLGNHVLIGMHATVMNGVSIGDYCIIGAGALLTQNTVIPSYSLVLGSPAKVVKQLDETQIEKLKRNADTYIKLAKEYSALL